MRAFDPRLLRHARASRRYLLVTVGLGLGTAALVLAQAVLLADGISQVVRPTPAGPQLDLSTVLTWLVVVIAARAGVAWAQDIAANRAAAAVRGQLRTALIGHVTRLGPAWLTGARSADLTHLATRGLDSLDAYFARYLPQVVLAAAVPLAVVAYLFPIEPVAAATMLLTAPLIPVFLALVGWTIRPRHDQLHAIGTRLARHVLELIHGLPTLKAYGKAAAKTDEISRLGAAQHRATMRTLRLAFLSSLVLELLATLSVALVAVEVGLRLVGGGLDLRTALIVLILAPEVYLPLRQLGAQHHASADGLAAATEVFAVLDEPVPPRGSIVDITPAPLLLEAVTVRYQDRSDAAVQGLSMTVGAGETVALTGPSGCGKSTVVQLLLGFTTAAEGRVLVGGRPLSELDPDAWRSQVAWVPQRPTLFAGTVEQNIRLGDPGASLDRVRAAARDAGIESHLSTVVGFGAPALSAGERQRVALARAFVRDAPVLLLDEPTANLDPATEDAIVERLATLCRGRTVLVVAHHPALLRLADRVVTLALPERDGPPVPPSQDGALPDPGSGADVDDLLDSPIVVAEP